MKTSALISFFLLLPALNPSAAAPSSTAPKIWMTAGPYVRWINPPANPPAWWAKRSDDWKMFTPQGEKQWSTVASHVAVLTTAGHSIEASCLENRTTYVKSCNDLGLSNEQSLDQYFRYIKAHHLAFAFEIGLLTDTQIAGSAINAACGKEAFGREASLRFVFQKIKDAGGEIDYIRMDEPFYYGTRSCHDSVANVASDLTRTINNIVRAYFPDVQIGDAEPTTGRPGDAKTIGQWAEAYRVAVGRPLAFFHADAAWDAGPAISNFAAIAQVLHKKSIPFGIFYNGADDTSNRGWTQSAIDHFVEAESARGLRIDQPLFQAWTAYPTNMLPEKAPGTLLNVAFQYVLPPTALTLARSSGGGVQIQLTYANKLPVSGASVSADAADVSNAWGALTRRVITGKTPANAAYGVIGIRTNDEGVVAAAKGEADLGAIIFHYHDPSSKARTWKTTYPVPYRVALSPNSNMIKNLPGLTTACGNSVLPLAADTPFTLEVPMSATASADHAGYVTAVFLNEKCHQISRAYLFFGSSSHSLKLPVTDTAGQIRLKVPKNLLETKSQLRVYYHGDNASHRPSMGILELR